MSAKRMQKPRPHRAKKKKRGKSQRTKKEKARAIATEAIDRVGTVLFLEYFMPHYIEPSVVAAFGVLGASVLVFLIRVFREMKK